MQNGTTRIISPPPADPVTLAEAREQVRQDFTTSDEELARLILSATQWAEDYMRRYVVQRVVELRLHYFPGCGIELPGGDVQEVTAVNYTDTDGNAAIFTDYMLDGASLPAVVTTTYGATWPPTRAQRNAVAIQYRAGFAPGDGSPTDYRANIPEPIRHAILLHIEAHYDRDSRDMPALLEAASNLLYPFRINT